MTTQSNSNPFFDEIIADGYVLVAGIHETRKQEAATLEGARASAISLIEENIDFFENGEEGKEPNLIYTKENGKYVVGCKYSNRFVKGWYNGKDKIRNVDRKNLVRTLKGVKWAVENGDCDTGLQEIMAANLELRSKIGKKDDKKEAA